MIGLPLLRYLHAASQRSNSLTHVPALLNEVICAFNSASNKTVLDLTFGFGGHSTAMLQTNEDIELFAFDRDPIAFTHAQDLSTLHPRLKPIKGRFSELDALSKKNDIKEKSIDFILMDLGSSSMQMDDGSRGFSLSKNAQLDMRMSQDSDDVTALDAVNYLGVAQLSDIFKKYGEERYARKIANVIVEYRTTVGLIVTTRQLADLVFNIVGIHKTDSVGRKAHPATQVFQALRIFVNDELNELCSALTFAKRYLRPIHGRCAVISFQSLEDRLVKWAFHGKDFSGMDVAIKRRGTSHNSGGGRETRSWVQDGDIITPSVEEVTANPRVRSAKMRIGRIVEDEESADSPVGG